MSHTLQSLDRGKIASTRPHGDRVRYVLGCRCLPCRAANSRYETGRLAARKNGDWNGVVSSLAARNHLRKLRRRGVGLRAVADVTGVSRTILQGIAAGTRAQCRKRTETAILAVDSGARSGGSIVPAGRTWRILRLLLADFTVEDDGLAQDWSEHGRVWLNPPYSNWSTWAERLACHGNGFALLFARTDTANFERTVWSSATALLFIRGRLKFYHSNGVESSKNGGAPSVIVAYGAECAGVLETCGINGRVVKLDTSVVVPISTQRRLRLEARARRTA